MYKLLKLAVLVSICHICTPQAQNKPLYMYCEQDDLGLTSYFLDGTYIKLTYSRPECAEDTYLFGSKIPYGELWQMGTGSRPELTVLDTVRIGEYILTPSTYSLLAVPDSVMWILVVSKELGQKGLYKYKKQNDAFRYQTPVFQSSRFFKHLSFFFEANAESAESVDLVFVWHFSSIRIPIERY